MGNKKKRKKKSKEQERRYSYTILVIVLCVCIVATVIAVVVSNNKSDSEDETSTSSTTSQTETSTTLATQVLENEQVYNSVNDLVMDKSTKEVDLNISNEESNSYNLRVVVTLESGDVIYESDLIAPGETLTTVTFDTTIEEGEYPVTISVDSYTISDDELASGVVYTRTLTVE